MEIYLVLREIHDSLFPNLQFKQFVAFFCYTLYFDFSILIY